MAGGPSRPPTHRSRAAAGTLGSTAWPTEPLWQGGDVAPPPTCPALRPLRAGQGGVLRQHGPGASAGAWWMAWGQRWRRERLLASLLVTRCAEACHPPLTTGGWMVGSPGGGGWEQLRGAAWRRRCRQGLQEAVVAPETKERGGWVRARPTRKGGVSPPRHEFSAPGSLALCRQIRGHRVPRWLTARSAG